MVPSNKLLTGMDMSLITVDDREKVLKEYLEMMADDYDFIIIDCMPSLGMLTINAMSAANSVLIPVTAPVLCCGWSDGTAESGERNKKAF